MDVQDGKRVSLLLEIFSMSCKQASRDLSTGIRTDGMISLSLLRKVMSIKIMFDMWTLHKL